MRCCKLSGVVLCWVVCGSVVQCGSVLYCVVCGWFRLSGGFWVGWQAPRLCCAVGGRGLWCVFFGYVTLGGLGLVCCWVVVWRVEWGCMVMFWPELGGAGSCVVFS